MTTNAAAGAPAQARDGVDVLEGATLAALVTLATIELVGYRYGDSNQGITVPILKRFVDPSLYPFDAMVATAERFPTLFYKLLAALLPSTEWIPAAFFVCYVASMAAAFAGVYRIGRWAGGRDAGLVALLIAIPTRVGIANEALYRVQFSHSHAASAIVIWAIVWFLEGRRLLPLLVLSLSAYNHVLYSIYVLVPCLLVVLWEARQVERRRTLVLLAAGCVPLVPFLVWSFLHRSPMTQEWLDLLKLRSLHHSFPGAFGESLPGGAFLIALGVLAASGLEEGKRRVFAAFMVGCALFFALGTVFTEFVPLKAVLQFQPHRCWRFLMLILYGLAARAVVAGVEAGGVARAAALATGFVLVHPQLEPLLPVAVFLQAAVGRPVPATWARLVAVGTLLALAGWSTPDLKFEPDYPLRLLLHPTVMGAAGLALLVLVARTAPRGRWLLSSGAALATLLWLAPATYERRQARWDSGAWRDVQDWVRLHTPKEAILLTPPQETGFRVFSERTVVGEWKDGTQQYFDEEFALEWGRRMEALGPQGFVKLPDAKLLELARRYRASYVVVPPRKRREGLEEVYRNGHYAVYAVPGIATSASR